MTFLRKLIQPSYKSGYAKSASKSAYPNLWDGLVGAWMPSLGVTGDTLRDVSSNGNHGTLQGMDAATDWVATSKGLALDFDGANDRIIIGAAPTDLVDDGGAFSICALVKPDFTNEQRMILSNGNAHRFYIETFSNGKFHWGIGGYQNSVSSQAAYLADNWYNYCVTYDGTSVAKGYLDGILSDTTQGVTNPVYGGTNLYIGQWASSLFWKGNIASVSVYNRVLSPTEIKQLYVDSLAPFRQRRYAPVSLQTEEPLTLLEKIRSVAKPTTTRAISVKKNSVPSYKSGYAKSASESANPKLWDGLVGAWVPEMGSVGLSQIPNAVDSTLGTLTGFPSNNLTTRGGRGLGLEYSGSLNERLDTNIKVSDIGGTGTTYCAFYRPDASNEVAYIMCDRGSGGTYSFILNNAGTFYVRWDASGFDRQIPAAFTSKEWHLCCLRWDGANAQGVILSEDGSIQKTTKGSVGSYTSGYNLFVGNNDPSYSQLYEVDGVIGASYIWNRWIDDDVLVKLFADSLAPFRKKTTVGYQPSKELRGLFRT